LAATARQALDKLPAPPTRSDARPLAGSRPVYLDSAERPVECAVHRREMLQPGDRITGPAVIHEYASTTLLFPGDVAVVAESADLIVHLGGQPCP